MKQLFMLIIVAAVGFLLYQNYVQKAGSPSTPTPRGSGASDDSSMREARDHFEREIGNWMAGRKSEAETPTKNPDGTMVWNPVLLDYEVKSFQKRSYSDNYEAIVAAKLKSNAGTTIQRSITFVVRPDGENAGHWKVGIGRWGDE